MGTASLSARKLAIVGAFVVAAAVPSIAPVLFSPTDLSAQGCTSGEEGDAYTGACVPYLVPNSPNANPLLPVPQPGQPGPLPPSLEEQDLAEVVTPGY